MNTHFTRSVASDGFKLAVLAAVAIATYYSLSDWPLDRVMP